MAMCHRPRLLAPIVVRLYLYSSYFFFFVSTFARIPCFESSTPRILAQFGSAAGAGFSFLLPFLLRHRYTDDDSVCSRSIIQHRQQSELIRPAYRVRQLKPRGRN